MGRRKGPLWGGGRKLIENRPPEQGSSMGRRRKIERKSVARARVLYGAAEENSRKTGRQSKGPLWGGGGKLSQNRSPEQGSSMGRRRKIKRKSVARARVLYGAAEENGAKLGRQSKGPLWGGGGKLSKIRLPEQGLWL